MRISGSKNLRLILMALAAVTLAACGSVSRNIAADGSSAGELKWPASQSVTPTHKGGTFPDVARLRLIQSGMNKQQISQLIGFPHYSEGLVGVREWNYLFNFRMPNSNGVFECQYKVLFDDHKLARSFYVQAVDDAAVTAEHSDDSVSDGEQPATCGDILKPENVTAVTLPTHTQTFTFSTDALFAFDKSGLADIKPNGEEGLDSLARKIAAASPNVGAVVVAGYTDRLGADAYNATLSQQRADTVMRYLESQGVASEAITATGRGAADPVKQCAEGGRKTVIACLAPNRRVEVKVSSK